MKTDFASKAFEAYDTGLPVKKSFEQIWMNMAAFKLNNEEEASFLSQCDNTPLISEDSKQIGIQSLQPLFDLWSKGQKEGIIKELSPYLLYAFTIYPMAFLIGIHKRDLFTVDNEILKQAFQAAWDSIKV